NVSKVPKVFRHYLWRLLDGIIWVLAVNVINREGEIIKALKLIGGKADEYRAGYIEYPLRAFIREVLEESGGIRVCDAEEVFSLTKDDYESSFFTAKHTMHFFLVGPEDHFGDVGETTDSTPAFWVPISEFGRNHLHSHHEGFFACLDLACEKYPGFLNILRTQKYFENFEPKEKSE
ncbi:hypothetical protein COW81_03555, partial [Candidatus Campbellbacteria bacterium CG22_combo_CG10-13_8_21_14_all_36_13]